MYLIDGSDIIHKYKTKEFLDFYLFTKNNFEIYLKNISKENIYPEKILIVQYVIIQKYVKIFGRRIIILTKLQKLIDLRLKIKKGWSNYS